MSYLCYVCLFAYSGVQHILCCVFVFFLVYPIYVAISLDCQFLIAPLIFSNIDLYCKRGQHSEISPICKVHVYMTCIFHHF